MTLILGIETSCDETGAAVYDSRQQRILSNAIFSQIQEHEKYGGVVPEIASRSQLEKINPIIQAALHKADISSIEQIDTIAVAQGPGLAGSLFVGLCYAKGISWARNKKLIGVNHLEAHIFSSFLKNDFSIEQKIDFPHLCLSVSGGHTALYLVKDFGQYEIIGQTTDDAAGEAFDKIAKVLGFGYPGGPVIEKLAQQINFQDFLKYPRTKRSEIFFSFSGLKTAVLYDLVKKNAYDLKVGPLIQNLSVELKQQVASSMLVCIADIFVNNVTLALKQYPEIKSFTFVGGVACNKYLRNRLEEVCKKYEKGFFSPSAQFCTDNAAMIAFVGGYKAPKGEFADLSIDIKI